MDSAVKFHQIESISSLYSFAQMLKASPRCGKSNLNMMLERCFSTVLVEMLKDAPISFEVLPWATSLTIVRSEGESSLILGIWGEISFSNILLNALQKQVSPILTFCFRLNKVSGWLSNFNYPLLLYGLRQH